MLARIVVGIPAACLLATCVAGCSRPARDDVIEQALLAKTSGFGGCDTISRVVKSERAQYPGVTFVQGTCVAEHGDTISTTVATDGAEQLFLLDSPSSFYFMLRMHPAAPVARDQAVGRVVEALQMMGISRASDSVVATSAAIPDSILGMAGIIRGRIWESSQVARDLEKGYEVKLLLLGHDELRSIIAIVYKDSGIVRVVTNDHWSLERRQT